MILAMPAAAMPMLAADYFAPFVSADSFYFFLFSPMLFCCDAGSHWSRYARACRAAIDFDAPCRSAMRQYYAAAAIRRYYALVLIISLWCRCRRWLFAPHASARCRHDYAISPIIDACRRAIPAAIVYYALMLHAFSRCYCLTLLRHYFRWLIHFSSLMLAITLDSIASWCHMIRRLIDFLLFIAASISRWLRWLPFLSLLYFTPRHCWCLLRRWSVSWYFDYFHLPLLSIFFGQILLPALLRSVSHASPDIALRLVVACHAARISISFMSLAAMRLLSAAVIFAISFDFFTRLRWYFRFRMATANIFTPLLLMPLRCWWPLSSSSSILISSMLIFRWLLLPPFSIRCFRYFAGFFRCRLIDALLAIGYCHSLIFSPLIRLILRFSDWCCCHYADGWYADYWFLISIISFSAPLFLSDCPPAGWLIRFLLRQSWFSFLMIFICFISLFRQAFFFHFAAFRCLLFAMMLIFVAFAAGRRRCRALFRRCCRAAAFAAIFSYIAACRHIAAPVAAVFEMPPPFTPRYAMPYHTLVYAADCFRHTPLMPFLWLLCFRCHCWLSLMMALHTLATPIYYYAFMLADIRWYSFSLLADMLSPLAITVSYIADFAIFIDVIDLLLLLLIAADWCHCYIFRHFCHQLIIFAIFLCLAILACVIFAAWLYFFDFFIFSHTCSSFTLMDCYCRRVLLSLLRLLMPYIAIITLMPPQITLRYAALRH